MYRANRSSVLRCLESPEIDIAILNTICLPLEKDPIWEGAIKPKIAAEIGLRLEKCGSDGLFLEVKPEDDMELAIKKSFPRPPPRRND